MAVVGPAAEPPIQLAIRAHMQAAVVIKDLDQPGQARARPDYQMIMIPFDRTCRVGPQVAVDATST